MDKYFTPDITDIRVGYECEISPTGLDHNLESSWKPHIITQVDRFTSFVSKGYIPSGYGTPSIRVPFLTKEQIEADGWNYKETSWRGKHAWFFDKGNFMMVFNDEEKYIEIIARDVTRLGFLQNAPERFRVTLPCKDINTLRYICKLLKINNDNNNI